MPEQIENIFSEKMLVGLVTAIVLGLLSWNVYTTHQLSVQVAVMAAQLDQQMASSYTEQEARSRAAEVNRRFTDLERRVEALEN